MEDRQLALQTDLAAILLGCEGVGLDVASLRAFAAEYDEPEAAIARVWREVMRRRPEPLTPLWIGASVPFGHYGLLDFMGATCSTVERGLELLVDYFQLLSSKVQLTFGNGRFCVRPVVGPPAQRAVLGAYSSGVILSRCRGTAGAAFQVLAASFATPASGEPERLTAFLGDAAYAFDVSAEAFEFELAPETLALPLRQANPGLAPVLQRYAADLLEHRGLGDDPLYPVREAVSTQLPTGNTTLESTAKRLGVSDRTLQRRLSERGLSFREILSSERQRLAKTLLQNEHPVSEVALLLGYSEQTTFARAFRRWTGMSPRQYRLGLA